MLEDRFAPAAWTGLGADNLWSNDLNWDTGDAPNIAGESAVFANADVSTVEVDGAFTVDSLSFTNPNGSWLLNPAGGSLTIVNAGTLTQSGTGTNQIAAQLNGTGLNATISAGSLELSNTTVGVLNSILNGSIFHIQGPGRLIATGEDPSGASSNPLSLARVQFDGTDGGVLQVRAKAIAEFMDFSNPITVVTSATVEYANSPAGTRTIDWLASVTIAAGVARAGSRRVVRRLAHVQCCFGDPRAPTCIFPGFSRFFGAAVRKA